MNYACVLEVMVGLREEGLTNVTGLVILFQRKTLHIPLYWFFLTTYTLHGWKQCSFLLLFPDLDWKQGERNRIFCHKVSIFQKDVKAWYSTLTILLKESCQNNVHCILEPFQSFIIIYLGVMRLSLNSKTAHLETGMSFCLLKKFTFL